MKERKRRAPGVVVIPPHQLCLCNCDLTAVYLDFSFSFGLSCLAANCVTVAKDALAYATRSSPTPKPRTYETPLSPKPLSIDSRPSAKT
ncbi:hypothetical protein Zmor_020713 [Zophobas morio]|uniref:Uncharacterized protein n=1 Tax=Zophobas morio TaxID=2755281 RepID=A0AA38I494_9CUCU|nr:hypothetical protein Zmor_020713 [Zophobas morio]